VLALVPHYRCELWLADCLESLLSQTRTLQGIAVIDDASPEPPTEIVRRFPSVTLLRAARNVGPYRLIQQVIDDTDYDGYLFNDADDWSAPERLELLLNEAERTGAELVGSQDVRVMCFAADVRVGHYPRDANRALAERPDAFVLLHPSSLVSRRLVQWIGGFATGMRMSGDAEFQRRAAYAAVVRNIPFHCYFRRKREGALTSAQDTGLRSPARFRVHGRLRERAFANADRARAGAPPDLSPLSTGAPLELVRLLGPKLRRSPHASRRSFEIDSDPAAESGGPHPEVMP
jgi:glycosyltransferase involved in cell wall biosynthesis